MSPQTLFLTLVLSAGIAHSARAAAAAAAYRYRDVQGHWVFTDQPPPDGVRRDTLPLTSRPEARLHIGAYRYDDAESLQLVALNDCLCAITLEASVLKSEVAGLTAGTTFRQVLEPRTHRTLARMAPAPRASLEFRWSASLGSPAAQHLPSEPYRLPYGIGSAYRITQSYPSRLTHTVAESFYAIDFAMPDGTPVHAAREGLVINARHDSFKGAADPLLLDQANVVQILHDDGTIAVYAHLHWGSIRVHIGEHVARGQYIADSGSTGFSSGPHLHFAVLRNTGEEEVSLPVQFVGAGGRAVTAVNQGTLTAY